MRGKRRTSCLKASWSDRGRRKTENDDVVLEAFTLLLEAARLTARDIIGDISRRGYRRIVERWRQLPDGRIEFSMHRLPVTE